MTPARGASVADDPLVALTGADGTATPEIRVGPPALQRVGDDYAVTWPSHGVRFEFAQIRETPSGLQSEIVVSSDLLGELHWARLDLASTAAREGLARKLGRTVQAVPWGALLDRGCRAVALSAREGEPVIQLQPVRRSEEARYLVPRLLVSGETNLIVADGDTGKTMLADVLATAVAADAPLACGLTPSSSCPAMILDWETNVEEHQDRLAGILAGLGLSEARPLYYRSMSRPLADEAATVRREIAKLGVGLLVIDSAGPATGDPDEGASSTIRLFNALRSFGAVTRLVLAHVSKAAADSRGAAKPYGSVFAFNLARNIWQLARSEDEGDDLVLAAYHRKSNGARRLQPFGLRFEFRDGVIRLQPQDVGEHADLMARASVAYRIQKLLAGGALTLGALAEGADSTSDTVSRTLRRLSGQGKVIRLDDARWGLKRT